MCGADLVFRGAAAELECDRADIGDAKYQAVRDVLCSASVGDIVAFGGKACITSEGLWQLRDLTRLRKVE